jgi:serine protease Do
MRTLIARLITAFSVAVVPALAPAAELGIEAQARALKRASEAVVGLRVQAVDDARSASTLGLQRQGSGVVIGADGLVLTIGYLVLEAEFVELMTDDGRRLPARVVAYDGASGFGLVQALAPLAIEPVPLGRVDALAAAEPLVIVSGGDDGNVGMARLLARRGFSGWWEYHVDGALFTAPPRQDHSGAALFNTRGELLGIGSLLLADVSASGSVAATTAKRPGNMFVPVELLQTILPELRANGQSRASQRAWLGVNCAENDGEVRIVRVTEDSPADVAGLARGDRIVRIDGRAVSTLEGLWKALWSAGAPERAVTLEIERDARAQTLVVQTVDRAKTLRRPRGV